MKVCILVNEFPPDRIAGTALATRFLAEFLAQHGTVVHVIVTERSPACPTTAVEGHLTIHRLRTGSLPILRWLWRVGQIRKLVKQIAPDLLHGQSISCGMYAVLAAAGRGIPTLTSIQGYDLYESSAIQRRTEVRWALRCADRVSAVSHALAELGKQIAGVRDVEVLPHGFKPVPDLPDRHELRKSFDVRESDFILMCAARLAPIKGLDVLLHAIASIPGVTLWLAGEGAERQSLQATARNIVGDRVHFLGLLDHRMVAARMKAADLFVLPSRSEPFGIVLLEAMDAGLPIVATRVGGISELIAKENGLLVPPEDSCALATAIEELAGDPARRARMAEANRLKARQFRWDTVGNSYLRVYQELVGEYGHARLPGKSPETRTPNGVQTG